MNGSKTSKQSRCYSLLHAGHTFRWMLKTAVHNSAEQFRLEKEVPEARAVDGDVGALHLLLACRSSALWGHLLLLIVFIVQQLVVNVVLSHATIQRRWVNGEDFLQLYKWLYQTIRKGDG